MIITKHISRGTVLCDCFMGIFRINNEHMFMCNAYKKCLR